MSRRAQPLLQHIRSRSGSQPRWGGLAVALVFLLVGAPALSALRSDCDLCPPNCPMHQHRGQGEQAATPHLGCHGVAPGARHDGGLSVHCATCGHHAVFSGTVLPPVLLVPSRSLSILLAAQPAPVVLTGLSDRLADPPDTPPPIGAA